MSRPHARGMSAVVPSLLVRDMAESLAFYTRILGFERTGSSTDRDPPSWAEVRRGGAVFWLYADPPRGTLEEPAMSGTMYVVTDDVESLARELEGKVEPAWGPEVMEYGMLELAVEDPNGYYIAFAQPV